jgi:aminoglycoside 3-N-acetyltransferase
MCILGQWPDRTYHTSLDTPDNLSVEHIGRVGRMLMKAVLFMADADPEDVRALSKKVVANAHANLKAGEIPPERTLAHTKTILRQLSRLMPMNMRMEERHDIVEMRRKNQLVHGYLFQRPAFDMDAAKWMAKLTARVPKSQRTAAPIVRHPGGSLVPLKQFAGYLGGEHLSARECAQLYKSAGLYFGWGTNSWLQWAMDLANGKQTLDEIFHSLSQEGSKLKFESLLLAFRCFEKKGMVRFRPHLSARELLAAVRKVGIRPGDLVIAHTSLSEFGYFEGGPDTVIDALLKAVGPRGTLAVPTHSNSFIGNQPYDPETSPSLVGAVTERFLKRPGVIRSAHPSHSVAAFGPLAKELTDGHDHTIAPQGREGFWGKFVDAGGKVLLLCKLTSNTLLHSAELWAGVPYPPGQLHYMKNGKRIEVTTPGMPFHISSFAAVHEALARKRMLYKTRLGNGTIYSMRARDAIDVGIPFFQKNPILATKRKCPCRWCDYIRRRLGQPGALTAGS